MDTVIDESAAQRQAYVAVDLGASSGRVVVGSMQRDTWQFTEIHRFENRVVQSESGAEWDLDRLFKETLVGIRLAGEYCRENGCIISGVGVDSWGVDWALMSRDGSIELPVQSYRGAPEPDAAISTRSLTARETYEIAGVPDHAINTALRLGAQSAERSFTGTTLLFIPDLWIYWLTGAVGTDPTIASTSQLFNARTHAFSETILNSVGAAGLGLPPVEAVGSIAGTLSPSIRQATELAVEVPVFRIAGHDTAAAFAFADPGRTDGFEVLISSGTWSLVGASLTEPLTSSEAESLGFSNESGVNGTLLLRNLTGLWTLQECLREWNSPPIATLLAAVQDRPFDARTFDVAAPELFAGGEMESRIRSLCARVGRALDNSRESVVHAIVDSLAVAYVDGIRAVNALTGRRPDRIRIVGGGSQNERLCRLTAELSGLPVLAGPTEASAIGNIALQAAADGLVAHPAAIFDALGSQAIREYTPSDHFLTHPAEESEV